MLSAVYLIKEMICLNRLILPPNCIETNNGVVILCF